MALGKKWLFSIGNGAEIRPLEMGRKSPEYLLEIVKETFHNHSLCLPMTIFSNILSI